MTPAAPATIRAQIDELYRSESRRVFASLVRLLKDFDLADDAMHEAYAAAIESWPRDGVPANPRAWLVSAGKFKAFNSLQRQGRLKELEPEVAARLGEVAEANAARAETEIEDDRLHEISYFLAEGPCSRVLGDAGFITLRVVTCPRPQGVALG